MRRTLAGLMVSVFMFSVMAHAVGFVAAEETTILPGGSFVKTVTLNADMTISYSWSSNIALDFELRNQANDVLKSTSGTLFGFDLYTVDKGGVYTLEWTNPSSSGASLTCEVDISSNMSIGFLDDLGDAVVLALLIVLAVIVIVVVVVVLLVVRGKKQRPQPVAGPGAGVVPPIGDNCAVCGMPVNSSMAFCAKCGAKLR